MCIAITQTDQFKDNDDLVLWADFPVNMAAHPAHRLFDTVKHYASGALARYRKLHLFGKVRHPTFPSRPPRSRARALRSSSYGSSYSSTFALVGPEAYLLRTFTLSNPVLFDRCLRCNRDAGTHCSVSL